MPFNELPSSGGGSWPPTVLRLPSLSSSTPNLKSNSNHDSFPSPEEIDANPISFFLSSPAGHDDLDFDFDEDLSAGIESEEDHKSAIREISPSSLQRAGRSDDDGDDVDEDEDEQVIERGRARYGVPLSLKDFTLHHSSPSPSGRTSRTSQRHGDDDDDEEYDLGLGIAMAIPQPKKSDRGRPKVRLVPASGHSYPRGRGKTRSLSARRPQSWRVPSPDIWSIKEERESEEASPKKEKKEPEAMLSASAPATGILVQRARMKRVAVKPKKRVHWAV